VAASARASVLILLAAAAVIGALELLDSLVGSTPAQITSEPWSPLNALTGVGRVAFLAAIGVAATSAALAAAKRMRRTR